MADIINIPVRSFEIEDVRDAFYTQLASCYASLQENNDPEAGRRYYAVLRALQNMEQFWEEE